MYTRSCEVMDDPSGILSHLQRALEDVKYFDQHYKGRTTQPSLVVRAREFVKEYQEHYRIPRSILEGFFKWGEARTNGTAGLFWHKDWIRFRSMGDLILSIRTSIVPRNYEFDFERGGLILHFMGRPPKRAFKDDTNSDTRGRSLSIMRQEDPTLDFLVVNEGYQDQTTWKKKKVIDHMRFDPYLTRKQLWKMGFRGDLNLDLLADSLDGMQEWIRARTKPDECNILSNSQYNARLKKERRLPEVINEVESSSSNLARQSYDAQIYRALHGGDAVSGFLS